MLQWLIVGVVVYVVYVLYFREKKVKNTNQEKTSKKRDNDSEDMVECCICGTFVSYNEAYIKNGKFYCSKECMQKD